MKPITLRRTFHFVPGGYPQLLKDAVRVPADTLCFDLEDSVPPAKKVEARPGLIATIADADYQPREVLVRINGADTPWFEDDVRAVAAVRCDGILLPKAEDAGTIRKLGAMLKNAPPRLRIWCMIETPRGVLYAEDIAAADPRIAGFVIGSADLTETMGARHTPLRLPILTALTHTVLVARAYGLAAIDAFHPNFTNDDGFAESYQQSIELGFDGKIVVFAHQMPVAHAIFSPTEEVVTQARKAIADAGPDVHSGYENAHLQHHRHVIALADAIAERDRRLMALSD